MGDFVVCYCYFGMDFVLVFWYVVLLLLCEWLVVLCGIVFNSVLFNCYCDGDDGMGWYSDNEVELGLVLLIVLFSLGVEWCFLLCCCDDYVCKVEVMLGYGDLLLMGG